MLRRVTLIVAIYCTLGIAAPRLIDAQNLFEVQVFPDENLAPRETQIEIHTVAMPSGTRLPDGTLDPSAHLHLSTELSHGWSDVFETGLFIETSPGRGDRHAAFTGWHIRPKIRLPRWQSVPWHISFGFEYAFLKEPGDVAFRQAVAITPIVEHHHEAFELSINPGIEIPVKGAGAGSPPTFTPSAKAAVKVAQSTWASLEYYAETGSIKHFEPLADQHHIVMPAVDLRTAVGWDVNVGIGRGLTGASEHWVVKSIVAVRLPMHDRIAANRRSQR